MKCLSLWPGLYIFIHLICKYQLRNYFSWQNIGRVAFKNNPSQKLYFSLSLKFLLVICYNWETFLIGYKGRLLVNCTEDCPIEFLFLEKVTFEVNPSITCIRNSGKLKYLILLTLALRLTKTHTHRHTHIKNGRHNWLNWSSTWLTGHMPVTD